MTTRLVIAAALLGAPACAPEVPDAPTYEDDIAPILEANCIRCHADPAIGGAPVEDIALDSYDGVSDPFIQGLILGSVETGRMPPTYELDAWQIETIRAWVDAGGPRSREVAR